MKHVPILLFILFGHLTTKGQETNKSDTLIFLTCENLIYPADARKKGIQGAVKIKVTFDNQCKLIKHEIVKAIGYGCDEEAIKCLSYIEEQVKRQKLNDCGQGFEFTLPIHFVLD